MTHRKLISMVVSLALVLGGCAAMTEEQKAALGKVVGAVGGGVVAEKLTDHIDNDAVRAAAILAGAAAGAYIGDQFAKALSKRDQEKLFVAQQQAAGSGKPVTSGTIRDRGDAEGAVGCWPQPPSTATATLTAAIVRSPMFVMRPPSC